MTRAERFTLIAAAILAGALAFTPWHCTDAVTFEERWEPAKSLRPVIHPFEDIDSGKSDRGACVDRRPRCKVA